MTEPAAQSDLDWMAFLYITGEMPADEIAVFEEGLAVDQSARESIVRAMRLTQAIGATAPAVVPPSVAPRPAANQRRASWSVRRRSAAAMIAASAACVLFLASLTWQSWETGRPQITDSDAAGLNRLLGLWSASRKPLGAVDETADVAAWTDADFAFLDPGDEGPSELLIPDWMFAAASLAEESGDDPNNQPPEEN